MMTTTRADPSTTLDVGEIEPAKPGTHTTEPDGETAGGLDYPIDAGQTRPAKVLN